MNSLHHKGCGQTTVLYKPLRHAPTSPYISVIPPTALLPVILQATCSLAAKTSHIATLVERHSRFAMLIKAPSKDTTTVVAALSKHVLKLPATLRRSLTWDRGHKMAKHKTFTLTGMSKSTSAIRRVPGNAAPMKIPTAY